MCSHHVMISAELRSLPFMMNAMEKLQEKCQQHYILPPQQTYGQAASGKCLFFIRARAGFDLQGPYCFSKDYLLGPKQGACEVPIVFQMIIIRAQAGNLQGPYCFSKDYLGGQAQGAEGTCMQADAFPSGARNPVVIVKKNFLPLKVGLRTKPCMEGWCNLEG